MEKITFKKILPYAIICGFIFFIFLHFGYSAAVTNPNFANKTFSAFSEKAGATHKYPMYVQALVIIINNALIGFSIMMGGLLILLATRMWFGSLIGLAFNGYMLGVMFAMIIKKLGIFITVIGTSIHGILELPAIFLCAGVGLYLAYNVTLERCNGPVLIDKILKESVYFYVKVILPMFIAAGIIEIYISTMAIKMVMG
jgi:uncharacterized membrane protein SpoIIM required for sporulation